MDVEDFDNAGVSRIASAIGEPARAKMLYCLMDGHARTSTELAVVAEVSPSTASAHLNRLLSDHLLKVIKHGKHHFYSLEGRGVARVLEGLSVLAGSSSRKFVPRTPGRLRSARICYDHLAGTLGVLLHDRFKELKWISADENNYDVTREGATPLEALGIDLEGTRKLRRRFAYPCLDWSERRPHIGGGFGSALLKALHKKKWIVQDLDSRAVTITKLGRRELLSRFKLGL